MVGITNPDQLQRKDDKMKRLLLLIFTTPLLATGQSADFPTKIDLEKTYSQSIGDFIKAANKKNKTSFDTLFIGKISTGDIELPEKIENTQIRLVSQEMAEKNQKERPARTYINLIGWVKKENAEFIFVVFSNGFHHQYNYTISYTYNVKQKAFELEKIHFKGPPFDK